MEIIIAVLPGIGVLILLGRYTNFIRFIAESCSFVIFDREANINCTLAKKNECVHFILLPVCIIFAKRKEL